MTKGIELVNGVFRQEDRKNLPVCAKKTFFDFKSESEEGGTFHLHLSIVKDLQSDESKFAFGASSSESEITSLLRERYKIPDGADPRINASTLLKDQPGILCIDGHVFPDLSAYDIE
ncbi:MAG: hypothetical protein NT149_05045 [Candidatus Gottesmanbacteria bacterium]|nr:hypothetical protein [Candidatus Gottesmanbacteria bacterium]